MVGVEISAPGVDRLATSLGDAAEQVGDLDALDADLADEVIGVMRVPIRTGALDRSVHPQADALGFTIAAGGPQAPYAPIVHARNPFIRTALEQKQAEIQRRYGEHLADAVHTIQGD